LHLHLALHYLHLQLRIHHSVLSLHLPLQTNFTSLATPSQVGSGRTALVTLLHEGGHAAHFANITQVSGSIG
jgi:hypothetical protein